MSVATLYSAVVPIAAAPGSILFDFASLYGQLQPNNYLVLNWIYFSGQVGDAVEIWLRPLLASPPEDSVTIATVPAGALATNVLRSCYPVPNGDDGFGQLRLPFVLGATRSGAGNATMRIAVSQNEAGNR